MESRLDEISNETKFQFFNFFTKDIGLGKNNVFETANEKYRANLTVLLALGCALAITLYWTGQQWTDNKGLSSVYLFIGFFWQLLNPLILMYSKSVN